MAHHRRGTKSCGRMNRSIEERVRFRVEMARGRGSWHLKFLQELFGQASLFRVAIVAAGEQEHERPCGNIEHVQDRPCEQHATLPDEALG